MYRRFLNNSDYLGIITKEALSQMIRDNEDRYSLAEEAAEASIVEYLTDNYEVEKALEVGKQLMKHNPQITYPVGAHFYLDGQIYEALRSINGVKRPTDKVYWIELEQYNEQKYESAVPYSQLKNWQPGDVVIFQSVYFECLEPNGIDFNDIRIPGVHAWEEVLVYEWLPNVQYSEWEAVKYEGKYYALIDLTDLDLTINPFDSDNWGLIGEYDPAYNYEFNTHEYVEFEGKLYLPAIRPTADALEEGYNIRKHDPRNGNLKKHMVRMALYELCKLISPNNISTSRITDYETSIIWLRDANRCKINPQIPRKLDEENKPVTEYAIATFQRDYDPYKNPWHI